LLCEFLRIASPKIGAGDPGFAHGLKLLIFLVPLAGLEPARSCEQQILSLPRLPIPPQGPWGSNPGRRWPGKAADHSNPFAGRNAVPGGRMGWGFARRRLT
jgi:hypothetical protein